MKVGMFNKLTEAGYYHALQNRKRYIDFNMLGYFRSICENQKLDLDAKLRVRDAGIEFKPKFYEFLKVKDLRLYLLLEYLGVDLTEVQERDLYWKHHAEGVAYLKKKKMSNRQFGVDSKHSCGIDYCPTNGSMAPNGTRRYPLKGRNKRYKIPQYYSRNKYEVREEEYS